MSFLDKFEKFFGLPAFDWDKESLRVDNQKLFLRVYLLFSVIMTLIRIIQTSWGTGPPALAYFGVEIGLISVTLLCLLFLHLWPRQITIDINSALIFINALIVVSLHGGLKSLYAGVILLFIIMFTAFASLNCLALISAIGMAGFSFIVVAQDKGWFPAPSIPIEGESLIIILLVGNLMIFGTGGAVWLFSLNLTLRRKRLEESLNRYRSLVEDAPDPIIVYDARGFISMVNNAALDMLGYDDADELLGQRGDIITPLGRREEAYEHFKNFLALSEPVITDFEFIRKDGTTVPIEAHITPIKENDQLESLVAICRNVSNRVRMEQERGAFQEKLIMQDKMASLGRLILGIAHEYNNVLAGLRGYAQLSQIPGKENRMREFPAVAIELVDRAQDVTEGLLSFSERFEPDTKMVNPAEMIANIIKLLRKDFEQNGITTEMAIPEDVEMVTDAAKLQQVLLHIISNAQDAMPDGGMIKIEYLSEDNKHLIKLSDEGEGIPEDVLPLIFDPFFTTRGTLAAGSGTGIGLGLSICYSLIQGLGGEIIVESTVGVGTIFKIIIPKISE